MTTIRQSARELQKVKGIPYTEALRRVAAGERPPGVDIDAGLPKTGPQGDLILPTILRAPGTPRTSHSYRLGAYADGLGNGVLWTPMDGSVLFIVGGPGTGKSVLATTLAQQSKRAFAITRRPREWEGVEAKAIHAVEPGATGAPNWRIGKGDLLVADIGWTGSKRWVEREARRVGEFGHTLVITATRWGDICAIRQFKDASILVVTLKSTDAWATSRPGTGVVSTLSSAGAAFLVDHPYQPSSGLGKTF